MNTCERCRFWGVGVRNAEQRDWDVCKSQDTMDYLTVDKEGDQSGVLKTRSTFGCVFFDLSHDWYPGTSGTPIVMSLDGDVVGKNVTLKELFKDILEEYEDLADIDEEE